jgi:hypothetical protein
MDEGKKFPFGVFKGGKDLRGERASAEEIPSPEIPVPTEEEIAEIYSSPVITRQDREEVTHETLDILGNRDFLAGFRPKISSTEYQGVLRCFQDFQELWHDKPELFLPLRRQLLTSAAQLLVVAKRITNWIEKKCYPVVFARAVNEAKTDVRSFVFGEFNKIGLTPEKVQRFLVDVEGKQVSLRDELSFALEDKPTPAISAEDRPEVLVPRGDLTGETEWSIYIGTLYGLLRQIFLRDGGVGGRGWQEPDELMVNFLVCKFAIAKIESGAPFKRKENAKKVLLRIVFDEGYDGERHFLDIFEETAGIVPEVKYAEAMVSDVALETIRRALLSQEFNRVPEEDWLEKFHELAVGMRSFQDHLWRAGFEPIIKE